MIIKKCETTSSKIGAILISNTQGLSLRRHPLIAPNPF
jgi:hypothetical protein